MKFPTRPLWGSIRYVELQLERVKTEVLRWGVTLREESWEARWRRSGERDAYYPTPQRSDSGIHWPSRTIFWPDRPHMHNAFRLLHELSHCLVKDDPVASDEVDSPMLALEYRAARRLHLHGWSHWMDMFGVTPHKAWGKLSTRERSRILNRSLERAQEEGLLDEAGMPTYRSPLHRSREVA